ncbi:MAG: acyl-ACP--UDP-N-acetylglucosamine O-acyltransferase [Acidobacteria bacterium]|nr:acyl-ACP--UDP-N-acetylglucosamine O-acyltransferase [Acidobacteriota bacterium]
MSDVHPTAVLEGDVRLGVDVRIGPYVVIRGPVEIGDGSVLDGHVFIEGSIRIGSRNRFFPFCSIGAIPQDLKYHGEESEVVIGDDNTFRESVTVNRGTEGGGSRTQIGDKCLIMAYSHVAHDCIIGNRVIMANGATLAGHIMVDDFATVGAFTGVHQFCRVGAYAYVGGYSVITKDALPFVKTVGMRGRAAIYGINSLGLTRLGFSQDRIDLLKRAYRHLFRSSSNLAKGLAQLTENMPITGDIKTLVDFIESSPRGVIHQSPGTADDNRPDSP